MGARTTSTAAGAASNDTLGRTLFVHWGQTGGGPRVLEEMSREFARRHPGEAAVSYNSRAENAATMEGLALPSLRVTTFRSRLGVVLNLPKMVVNSWRVRRFVIRHDIRTVVCTMESIYQSLLVPMLIPRDRRYVFAVHDATLHPGDEHIVKRLNRRAELRRADDIVTFSSAVADVMRTTAPATVRRVVASVLPASDVRGHQVTERTLPTGRPVVVGFFGRLVKYKGLDLFVEAAAILAARLPDIVLRVVGNGEYGVTVSQEDTSGAVTWDIRWIPEDEVVPVIGTFDVLALPYIEASQSGVLAQALSLGLPSVATPVGGLAEQVISTGAGIVCDEVTAQSFAEAVERLISDPELYSDASRRCLAAAAGDYSWDRFLDDLDSLAR